LDLFHADPGRRIAAMDNDDLDVIADRRKKTDRRVAKRPFEGEDRRRSERRGAAQKDNPAPKAPK
jgi:hypothetical protein